MKEFSLEMTPFLQALVARAGPKEGYFDDQFQSWEHLPQNQGYNDVHLPQVGRS